MTRLNDLRIGVRLGVGFGAVLLLLVMIVGLACLRLADSRRGLQHLTEMQARAAVASDWLAKTEINMSRLMAIAKSSGMPSVAAHFEPQIKQTSAEIAALQKKLEATMSSDADRARMVAVAERRKAYLALRVELFEHLQRADQPAVDALLADRLPPVIGAYGAAMRDVLTETKNRVDAESGRLDDDVRRATVALVVLLAFGLSIGVAMAVLITRSVTGPLADAVGSARRIAANDLSVAIDSSRRDELGDLLRALGHMQAVLARLVGEVRSSTDSIGTASSEIASGTQDLSTRTEQTAANLQHAASSMVQLTGTVKQSADAARQANQLASSAAEVAARGGAVVSQVVATMDDINLSSKRIADIIGVIDGIAFQTNILALNAAVEAARAGEQGRGFAVVASEVRSLARRSAEAAKEIKTLIGASVEKVEGGSRLVADAGRTMDEIVGSVQRVADIIGEITAAAAEQSDGIGQVNGSVGELDQMTQQNAALVEQSAAAAESLRAQASQLAQAVAAFRLDGGSPAASPRAAAPAPGPAAKGATQTSRRPLNPAAPAPSRRATPPTPVPAPGARPVVAAPAGARDHGWETF